MRQWPVSKFELDRHLDVVEVDGHRIGIKVGPHGAKPEFDDVAACAAATGRSVRDVAAEASARWTATLRGGRHMSADDDGPQVDWAALRAAATAQSGRAYAPYSDVRVGAAALTADGRVVSGCNVENACSGLGICAEVNLCGHLVASGGGRLVALCVVAGDGHPLSPCGRCRQVLHEFGGPDLLVERDGGVVTLGALLPDAFGPDDVADRTGGG